MVYDIEGDGPGHPMQGQVPRHLVVLSADMLDVRTRKGDGGILLHVEEGGGPQVSVTQLVMGINAGCLYLGIDPGVGKFLLVNMKSTTKGIEASSRCADRHDLDGKRHV